MGRKETPGTEGRNYGPSLAFPPQFNNPGVDIAPLHTTWTGCERAEVAPHMHEDRHYPSASASVARLKDLLDFPSKYLECVSEATRATLTSRVQIIHEGSSRVQKGTPFCWNQQQCLFVQYWILDSAKRTSTSTFRLSSKFYFRNYRVFGSTFENKVQPKRVFT